jgi:hypothetical protein
MKIAFVHYHLKTGGVTTVIRRQIAALQGLGEALILTGDRSTGAWSCPIIEIPGLGYDRPHAASPSPDRIAEQVLGKLAAAGFGGCDILHVHNPLLAKNRSFLQILKRLRQAGINLFLQVHDFAEDGRPDLYFVESYPRNCHYGVINGRDYHMLIKAGLDPAGVHLIPNTVGPEKRPHGPAGRPMVLYPVRAIRRKNIGEALMLSLFIRSGQRIAITQPPNSPQDIGSYQDWVAWATAKKIPLDFEIGRKANYDDLVSGAASMITTSISEGFGLAFLEPWPAGKLLWGRRLSDVCQDFENGGICLKALYDRLQVPLDWIDIHAFSRAWRQAVSKASRAYAFRIPAHQAETAFSHMTRDACIDFGLLSEPFQRQVLDRLIGDPSTRADIAALNPWIAVPRRSTDHRALINANSRAVQRAYGMKRHRRRLLQAYAQVTDHPVEHRIDKRVLQGAFIDLDRFPLLKWSPYVR